jgi:hypothetical protein
LHGRVRGGCRDRNIGFAVVARSTKTIAAAISRTYTEPDSRWRPARRQNGEPRLGAEVAELTDLVAAMRRSSRRPVGDSLRPALDASNRLQT